jgi:hypothetical protein
MSNVPYANDIGNLKHAMVYTRLNIAHVVGVFEQVYVKTMEGALENCKGGFHVFA